MKTQQSKYKKELNTIRKRRLIVWLVFFGYFPFIVTSSKLFEHFYSNDPQTIEVFIPYLFFLFAFIWIVVIVNSATSICPKCDETFCHRSNMSCQQCHKCGLELRSDMKSGIRKKYGYLMPLLMPIFLVLLLIKIS